MERPQSAYLELIEQWVLRFGLLLAVLALQHTAADFPWSL